VSDWTEAVRTIGLGEDESGRKVSLFHAADDSLSRLAASSNGALVAHWVPGRVEFLGKHTDYAGGRSLLCTVERGIAAVGRLRDDACLRVCAAATGEIVEIGLQSSARVPDGTSWATYPASVARRLARNFAPPLRGADVSFASDLPIAAGMSSSSALVVAMFLTLSAINRLSDRDEYRRNIHTMEDLAEYVGFIESGFDFRELTGDAGVGTLSGCEDQTAMLCARPGALIQYSFCPVRFERAVPLPVNSVLAVASSGVRAEKTAGAMEKYNVLSRRARAVAAAWRQATGRTESTIAEVLASNPRARAELRHQLETATIDGYSAGELVERFEQFAAESEDIIPAVSDALARGDVNALGGLVDRSVEGAAQLLHNQIPETLALTQLARELGAVAASPFGAGFGGSVWALVSDGAGKSAARFVDEWKVGYVARFPEHASTCEFFMTRAGPASCRIA
jgi:galactokinase